MFLRLALLPLLLFALLVVAVIVALGMRVELATVLAVLGSMEVRFALLQSLGVSLAALAIALLLGVPGAWALRQWRGRGRMLLETVLDLPLVMPPLVVGVGLLFLFGRRMLGEPLASLGIELLFSPAGAVLAQVYIAMAVVLRSSVASFAALDSGYAACASTLGLKPLAVFVHVELPMAMRGIAAGAVLAWARALGEFGATLMVAGATRLRTETLPMAVYLNIASGDTDTAVVCALLQLLLAAGLLLALRLLRRPELPA